LRLRGAFPRGSGVASNERFFQYAESGPVRAPAFRARGLAFSVPFVGGMLEFFPGQL
jgi:hypothetical protein